MSASQSYNANYIIPANHNQFDPAPTKITGAGYELIESMAREGNGWSAICKSLGIAPQTLRKMRKEDPSIDDAYSLGKGHLDTEITTMLLKQARDNNITAQIFLAKTKLGWRENGPTGDTPTNATQVNIYVTAPMSDEQFAKLASPKGDEECK